MVALRMLDKIKAAVDVANNGQECIAFLDQVSYDLILMDCQMPILNGFEATIKIRAREDAKKHIPIVAMTAQALSEDRIKCLEHGMNDYLAKPVTMQVLFEKIQMWTIKVPQKEARHLANVRQLESSGSEVPTLDLKTIRSVVEINESEEEGRIFLGELLEIYRNTTPEIVSLIRKAVSSGNSEHLFKLFHKAKGASANIGAKSMAEFCAEMERVCKIAVPEDISARIDRLEAIYDQTMHAFDEYLKMPGSELTVAM